MVMMLLMVMKMMIMVMVMMVVMLMAMKMMVMTMLMMMMMMLIMTKMVMTMIMLLMMMMSSQEPAHTEAKPSQGRRRHRGSYPTGAHSPKSKNLCQALDRGVRPCWVCAFVRSAALYGLGPCGGQVLVVPSHCKALQP